MNNIFRINIFNKNGTNYLLIINQLTKGLEEKFSPKDFLLPIFNGTTDTLFLGIKEARFEDGE